MITRSAYYREMRSLALVKRVKYSVETHSLNLYVIRGIYKAEGIKIDKWDIKGQKLRASYFCDDDGLSVLLNKNLPREPALFSLAHELKHHFVDRDLIKKAKITCGDYNANETIEIAAEVFAAEFVYPEGEMRELINELKIDREKCTPERIVEFKRACPAIVSYSFLNKRFEWFGICARGEYASIKFQKLEEEIYGPPIYKQEWFKKHRARKNNLLEKRSRSGAN
jgi:Zn-dependent peptidase ImmA (M78 family)